MKNLVMIIHSKVQQELADRLRSIEQVQGFTFSSVEGHGVQVEHDPLLSMRDKVVGYVPRIRVDVLLDDTDVEVVLATLRDTENSLSGQGIYWIIPVENSGRL